MMSNLSISFASHVLEVRFCTLYQLGAALFMSLIIFMYRREIIKSLYFALKGIIEAYRRIIAFLLFGCACWLGICWADELAPNSFEREGMCVLMYTGILASVIFIGIFIIDAGWREYQDSTEEQKEWKS